MPMTSPWWGEIPLALFRRWRGSAINLERSGRAFILLVVFCLLQQASAKHECFAEPDGPKDDPNNIYKCEDSETCCQEGGQPSCCKTKETSVAAMEQVKLWGTLAVMILVLVFVMWYCRHDGDCCGNKKDGKEGGGCCGCCGGNKEDKGEIQEVMVGDENTDEEDDDDDDDDDKTPGPAVYNLPDAKHHPPPSDIPAAYRDMDFEVAQ